MVCLMVSREERAVFVAGPRDKSHNLLRTGHGFEDARRTARCDGGWREVGVAPYVTAVTAEPEVDRINPQPAAAHSPWIKPLSCYERRETTVVEGLRYG